MSLPQHELDKTMSEAQKKLEQIKESFQKSLGDKFNEDKYNEDLKNGVTITLEDKKKYVKEDDEDADNSKSKQPELQSFNNNGLSFKAHFKQGEYIAEGSNGHIVKSQNLDDFNRQIAKAFKVNAMTHHKDPECTFKTSLDPKSDAYKEHTKAFARNFINEGVAVKGDLPNDPEFWKGFKEEYLKNEKHQEGDWEKMTKFVPPEYMNEIKKEKDDTTKQKIPPFMLERMKNMGRV